MKEDHIVHKIPTTKPNVMLIIKIIIGANAVYGY